MFIGHFGVALAAKRVSPRTSLGTLVMAAQLVDLVWPVFLLLGVERVIVSPGATAVTPLDFIFYPFTHSLLGAFGWACLFAGAYKVLTQNSGGAVCLWFVVMSHWVLDAITHQPDLPLFPGSSIYIGFGLWNSRLWTLVIEGALFVIGAWLYSRATVPSDLVGKYSYRAYLAFLVVIYILSIFGPTPPGEKAVAYSALGVWLFVAWAYFIDHHRTVRGPSQPIYVPYTGPPPESPSTK